MSSTPSSQATKRLLQEIKAIRASPSPSALSLGPINEAQLQDWTAVLLGPPSTAYSSGRWKLSIHIPPNYPLEPPSIKFVTPCCHPNVHFQTGEICFDLLKKEGWTPAYTIASTVEAIQMLLRYPEVDSPLNVDIASLIRQGDKIGWEGVVRFWCLEKRWDGDPER